MCELGVITYGITSIPNCKTFCPAILLFFNASDTSCDEVGLGWVGLDWIRSG
jgi:hypothetical protein